MPENQVMEIIENTINPLDVVNSDKKQMRQLIAGVAAILIAEFPEMDQSKLEVEIKKQLNLRKSYILRKDKIVMPTQSTLNRAIEILDDAKKQIREGFIKQAEAATNSSAKKNANPEIQKKRDKANKSEADKILAIKKPIRQALHAICEIIATAEYNKCDKDTLDKYNKWLNETIKAGKELINERLKNKRELSKQNKTRKSHRYWGNSTAQTPYLLAQMQAETGTSIGNSRGS